MAESVSQDLRFCVVADRDVSVEDGVDNSGVSKESSEDAYKVAGTVARFGEGHRGCRFQQRPRCVQSYWPFPEFASQEVGHENPFFCSSATD